ncbi:Rieske (2Fe-2S) protein [Nonomuraea sp. NPDC048826]|uniref:Rieske (2Fe-2S) protein n=1 Tax=Nonomuraea sp. NPDC048826 TaxID=3364347 RepID=UPI00371A7A1C
MGEDLKSRRAVFAGVGAGGLTLALAACGGGDTTTASPESGAPASSSAPSSGAPAGGGGLATTSEIPVGGGKIFTDQKVVVVQPAEGQFKAFGINCTHQGCPVDKIENGAIVCPCHGSQFKIEDGSVAQGPATDPLAEQQIKVEGDQISLA